MAQDAKNASAPVLTKTLSRYQRAELAARRAAKKDNGDHDPTVGESHGSPRASLQRMKTRQRVLSIYQEADTKKAWQYSWKLLWWPLVVNLAWLALPLRRPGVAEMDTYLYIFLHHGVYMIVATWFGLVLFRVGMPIPSIWSQIIIVIACLVVAYGMDVAILQYHHDTYEYILPAVTVGASIPFFIGAFITQVLSSSKEKDAEVKRKRTASKHQLPPVITNGEIPAVVATTNVAAVPTPLDNLTTNNNSGDAGTTTNERLVSSATADSSSNATTPSLEPITNLSTTAVAASSGTAVVTPTLVRVASARDNGNGNGDDAKGEVSTNQASQQYDDGTNSDAPPQHHYYSRFFLFIGVAACILITYCVNQYLVRLFMEIHDEDYKVLFAFAWPFALTPFRWLTCYFAGKVDEDTKNYEASFLIWLKNGGTIDGVSHVDNTNTNGRGRPPLDRHMTMKHEKAARIAELNKKNATENMRQGMARAGVVFDDSMELGVITTQELAQRQEAAAEEEAKQKKKVEEEEAVAAAAVAAKKKKAAKHRRVRTTGDRESDDELSDGEGDHDNNGGNGMGATHMYDNGDKKRSGSTSDDEDNSAGSTPPKPPADGGVRIDILAPPVPDSSSAPITPVPSSSPMDGSDGGRSQKMLGGSTGATTSSHRHVQRGDSLMQDGTSDLPAVMKTQMPAFQRSDSTQALMDSPEYAHFASLRHCSLLPVVEFGQDLLKLVFYRQLFINVTEIRTFIIFASINFARDIIRYPVRMHRKFYDFITILPIKLRACMLYCCGGCYGLCSDGDPFGDQAIAASQMDRKATVAEIAAWRDQYQYEEYKRSICRVLYINGMSQRISLFNFMACMSFLRYTYNGNFFPSGDRMSHDDFIQLLIFLVVMFFTEWISTALLTVVIRCFYQLDVMKLGSRFLMNTESRYVVQLLTLHILMDSYQSSNNAVSSLKSFM